MSLVLLTDYPWPDTTIERSIIEAAGHELVTGPSHPVSAEEVEGLVVRHDPAAIMTGYAPVTASAIAHGSKLRIVAKTGIGTDNIEIPAATARGVWVTNVPDYCIEEVSDHALALLLGFTRGIVAFDRDVKGGAWRSAAAKLRRFSSLVIGIVGYGRIGRATARKCSALGATVVAYDTLVHDDPGPATLVGLDELLARADAVVLHAPLLDSTHHLVDRIFLAKMRRGALLINTSRGPLVDNVALLEALAAGVLAGAGLDVIEGEPNPPHALTTRNDVIVTPHVAFSSDISTQELRRRASEEVVRVLGGARPQNPCNRVA